MGPVKDILPNWLELADERELGVLKGEEVSADELEVVALSLRKAELMEFLSGRGKLEE